MKIKRFLAPDMRTALQQVRQEHGPDAVILSNRVTPEGVEIVAASQYDEETVLNALATSDTNPLPEQATTAQAPATLPETQDSTPPAAFTPAVLTTLPDIIPTPATSIDPASTPDLSANLTESTPPAPAADETALPFPAVARVDPPMPDMQDIAPEIAPVLPAPTSSTVTPSASTSDDTLAQQMQQGFTRLQQLIERGFQRIVTPGAHEPALTRQLRDWLAPQGFSPDLIAELATQLGDGEDITPDDLQSQVTALLSERLPVSASNLLDEGGALALIGPSGAGKTTIVGKLAAHYSVRHGVRDIALISLDHARPGGSDRLYSLARQLGIAVHEADSSQSLATLLQWLQDYHLILIDGAGLAPHDPQFAEHLEWLRAAESVRSLLVLPANLHHADLDDVVSRFQPVQPQGAIVTKLDETRRPGGVLSATMAHQLPLSWVSDGQHLHDDLHRADAARLLRRIEAIAPAADDATDSDSIAALLAPHAFA